MVGQDVMTKEIEARLDHLKALLKQREDIDEEITEILGISTPKKIDMKKHGSAAGIKYQSRGHECCGSKGNRHKNGCKNGQTSLPSKKYRCTDCDYNFKSDEELLDATCPECKSTVIVQV